MRTDKRTPRIEPMNYDDLHLETGLIRVGAYSVIVESDHVLMVRFDDDYGPHYNFPGGGHNPGETLLETVVRETEEEAAVLVDVGRLLIVTEYPPFKANNRFGPYHKLGLFYEATLRPGQEPRLPDTPDPFQVGVEWVPLTSEPSHPVLPDLRAEIVNVKSTAA